MVKCSQLHILNFQTIVFALVDFAKLHFSSTPNQLTFDKKTPPQLENQLHVLNNRTNFLKYTMGFAAFGFLFNMTTVLLLYLGSLQIARLNFAACCLCMIVSIFLFLQEIRLSNQALKYHLSDMDSMKNDL